MPVKILILGGGQVGSSVVENLCGDANDITVVDTEATKLRELSEKLDLRTVCGGSRSHAFAVSGDPLAEDPTCAYQPPLTDVVAP